MKLIITKSRGDLILPSLGVYTLALATEKLFRRVINCNRDQVLIEPQFGAILCSKILRELLLDSRSNLFPDLNTHIFDDTTEELSGHVFLLLKLIIRVFRNKTECIS